MTAGERIKRARIAAQLTQDQLGERLDPKVTRQTIHLWETDQTNPRAARQRALARILKLQVKDLVPVEQ